MNDDMQAVLLQALASGGGSESPVTPAALLAQLGDADPTVALLMNAMLQRQSVQQPQAVEQEPWPGEGGLAVETSQSERRLLRRLEHLAAELHVLQARNDAVSAALGACYVCWGDDPACEVCGGRGSPGFFDPDESLFAELIAPAVDRPGRRHAPARSDPGAALDRTNDDPTRSEGGER